MRDSGEGRFGELTRQGLAAAIALAWRLGLARRLGLPAGEPVMLSSRGNLLVHLAPAPVVARVATLTAWTRRDPFGWLAREVAVAGYVAGRGGLVVAPARTADPGPHLQDGFAISLWEYLTVTAQRPAPVDVGAALASLHLAAAGCPAELGNLTPARDQTSEGLDALERESVLEPAVIAALRARHEAVLAELAGTGPPIVLHGDAHAGNLLAVAGNWCWVDLEETCRGPVEWDLATMAEQAGPDAPAALRGYAERAGCPVPGADDLAPFRQARMLEAMVWTLCMAHLHPDRYRDYARERLAAFLRE